MASLHTRASGRVGGFLRARRASRRCLWCLSPHPCRFSAFSSSTMPTMTYHIFPTLAFGKWRHVSAHENARVYMSTDTKVPVAPRSTSALAAWVASVCEKVRAGFCRGFPTKHGTLFWAWPKNICKTSRHSFLNVVARKEKDGWVPDQARRQPADSPQALAAWSSGMSLARCLELRNARRMMAKQPQVPVSKGIAKNRGVTSMSRGPLPHRAPATPPSISKGPLARRSPRDFTMKKKSWRPSTQAPPPHRHECGARHHKHRRVSASVPWHSVCRGLAGWASKLSRPELSPCFPRDRRK